VYEKQRVSEYWFLIFPLLKLKAYKRHTLEA
jgi:hypothetical protein